MMKRVDTYGIRGSILCSKSTKGVIFFDSSWERDFIQFCNNCDEILKFEIDPVNDYVWNNKLHEIFVDVGKYVYEEFKKYYKDMDYLDKVNKPKDMEELDGDNKVLKYRNKTSKRDIVQFVPLANYISDPTLLASETLKEIPKQVTEFASKYKYRPKYL